MDQYLLISPSLPPVDEIRQYLSSLIILTSLIIKPTVNAIQIVANRRISSQTGICTEECFFFSTPILSEADLMSLEYLEESPQGSE